jgi:hypothetical protein
VGADKGYDTKDFVSGARNLNATPHVAQNIYSALLNDSARNGMIAADVVQAIPPGRCPLLLSLLQRAIACNAQRQIWHPWHHGQRGIRKLQFPLRLQGSESLSLRHNRMNHLQTIARHKRVIFSSVGFAGILSRAGPGGG